MNAQHSAIRNDISSHESTSMHMRGKLAVAIGLFAFSCVTATTTIAAPAPWFYWKSIVTGERVCSQFSPADGWVQEQTPYKDARCAARY